MIHTTLKVKDRVLATTPLLICTGEVKELNPEGYDDLVVILTDAKHEIIVHIDQCSRWDDTPTMSSANGQFKAMSGVTQDFVF